MVATSVAPAAAIAKPAPAPAATRGTSAQSAQTAVPFFGPKRYTRTAGPPNVFNETIAVPPWLVGPYTLRVQNGEPDGTHRLSSASIVINGVTVASQSNFNQNVAGFDRTVTLTPSTTMTIRLQSTPGGYLTINLAGTNADRTPPQVAIVAPVPGSSSTTVSPRLVVSYRDLAGAGEPGASGANLPTLKVTLDNVDRTSLFTRGADQASADLAGVVQLGEGVHTLAMTIQDAAGNAASTSAQFRVDRRPRRSARSSPAPAPTWRRVSRRFACGIRTAPNWICRRCASTSTGRTGRRSSRRNRRKRRPR